MIFYGLQKLSLVDFPGKMACTVFTGGCNFRCPFCHNSGLVTDINEENAIDEEEVISFLRKRAGMLDGICISGGEPLMYDAVGDFAKRAKELGYSIKLDTNGSFPERLEVLIGEGAIDYVAMDIKNSPEKYAETVGIKDYDISNIKKSIALLMEGRVPYEFRTTLVREFHTLSDMDKIGEWIGKAPAYYLQAFKDSGHLIGDGLSGFSKEEMQQFLAVSAKYIKNTQLRGV